MGEAEDVDVKIESYGLDPEWSVNVQVKRRKTLPAYLQIPDSCSAVYFRQDRGPGLVLLRVEDWLESL